MANYNLDNKYVCVLTASALVGTSLVQSSKVLQRKYCHNPVHSKIRQPNPQKEKQRQVKSSTVKK